MIKPKKLQKGDKIAIVSLSSGIMGEDFCRHELEIALNRLRGYDLMPIEQITAFMSLSEKANFKSSARFSGWFFRYSKPFKAFGITTGIKS